MALAYFSTTIFFLLLGFIIVKYNNIDNKQDDQSNNVFINNVKTICSSPISLYAFLAFSITVYFNMITIFHMSKTRDAIYISAIIFMIPKLIIWIGLFIINVSSKNHYIESTLTKAISFIKVGIILTIINFCIETYLLTSQIISQPNTSTNYGPYFNGFFGVLSFGAISKYVIFTVLLIICLSSIVIFYYFNLLKSLKMIRHSVITDIHTDKALKISTVLCFVFAFFMVLGAIRNTYNNSNVNVLDVSEYSIYYSLSNAILLVLVGIIIIKYRNAMRQLMQNSA